MAQLMTYVIGYYAIVIAVFTLSYVIQVDAARRKNKRAQSRDRD